MLPAGARLRSRPDVDATVRRGRRRAGRSSLLVLHVLAPDGLGVPVATGSGHPQDQPLAGFVVGRTVGGAVVRNRVRRRLRHLVAARLPVLPAGATLVVRALPGSAAATSDELGADLDSALLRAGLAAHGADRTEIAPG